MSDTVVKYDCGSCQETMTGLIDFKAHILGKHEGEYETIEAAVTDATVFKGEVEDNEQ